MQIKRNITINLSQQEVREILAEYFCSQGYKVTVEDVGFSVGTRLEGYGMAEHEVTYFDGAYIQCNEK